MRLSVGCEIWFQPCVLHRTMICTALGYFLITAKTIALPTQSLPPENPLISESSLRHCRASRAVSLVRKKLWFRGFGTEKSPGNKIFSLSGCVNQPGNYELPLGTTFRQLIFGHGGGIPNGGKIKAIMPAGASSSLIVANEQALDTPMDYESVPSVGAQLGSASVIVIDETVSIDWVIYKTLHFFKHESCGKCTPCREGTFWMGHLIDRIHSGESSWEDVELLREVAQQVKGKCLCALGEFSIEAVISGIERFEPDFQAMTSLSSPVKIRVEQPSTREST